MSDEQSPEANLSKRERQKARRAQRLEAERAAAASAKRRRLGGFVLVGVLLAGTVGFFVQRNLAERAEQRELIADALDRLDELGCTPDEEMPHLGAGHFGSDEAIAASPPEAIYAHLPTTSGEHMGQVTATGVHDHYVDERLVVHNLEHGYVTIWYDEDADPDQIEELRAFGQEQIDGGTQELIVAPYDRPMDDDANFAFVAWDRRQLCEQFDEGIALNFIDQHMNHQRAPETFAGPHFAGEQGVVDPDPDGPLVFPPLGDAADAPAGPRMDATPEGDLGHDDDEDDEDADLDLDDEDADLDLDDEDDPGD